MSREERRQAGWRELHNSILANIQDSTKELSSLFEKKEAALNELPRLTKEIENAQKSLEDILKSQSLEKERTLSFWSDIRKAEDAVMKDKIAFEEYSKETKDGFLRLEAEVKSRVESVNRQYNQGLVRIEDGRATLESITDEMNDRAKEISSLHTAEQSLREIIRGLQGEVSGLRDNCAEVNKEIMLKQKESAIISKEIDRRRKEVLNWKNDMEQRDKKISIREKDLTILEGRVRRRLSGLMKQSRKGLN